MDERAAGGIAARNSATLPAPKPAEYESLLSQLPETERQEFLLRLLRGETNLAHQLQQRLLAFRPAEPQVKRRAAVPRRTIGALLNEAEAPATAERANSLG